MEYQGALPGQTTHGPHGALGPTVPGSPFLRVRDRNKNTSNIEVATYIM